MEAECHKWVFLLLHLVDFTQDKAEIYLKQFMKSRSKVLTSQKCRQETKKYVSAQLYTCTCYSFVKVHAHVIARKLSRSHVNVRVLLILGFKRFSLSQATYIQCEFLVCYLQVRDTTRANFNRMTIQQFGALFKAFKIYPSSTVEEFLGLYKVPQDIRINDPTWHSFINEVVISFGGARAHYYLLDFLKSVAEGYLADKRQQEFVMDLLQLKVPKLFAIEEGADETMKKEDATVARKFSTFLRNFINRHALKNSILSQMTALLVSTSLSGLQLRLRANLSPKLDLFIH